MADSENYIHNAKDAKASIGKRVYWDDISVRYHFIREGILQDIKGKNLLIGGSWCWRSDLRGLRNFKGERE